MPRTTPEQLERLKALSEAATPEPWIVGDWSMQTGGAGPLTIVDSAAYEVLSAWSLCGTVENRKANIRFAAESRNALAALIADAEAYHALLAFIRERVQAIEREVAELIRTGQATHAVQLGMIAGAVEAVADWAENEEAVKEGADAIKV